MPIEKDREEASDDDGQRPRNEPQLEAIRLEVQRLAEMLNALNGDDPSASVEIEASSPISFEQGRAAQAARMYKERRLRDQFLPSAFFAEPAWDMLLDLYSAHYRRSDVSICSLCLASCVPTTTAHRWIDTMEDAKLFKRTCDQRDRRRVFIELTEVARLAMDRYFDRLALIRNQGA
jgi:DNA-binding MarR family transcriptional regulator